jgi:hypothetical protein
MPRGKKTTTEVSIMYYKSVMMVKAHTLNKLFIEDRSKGFEKTPGGIP